MDSLLALLGVLFFMFLVLATAVEIILEVFRGLLERFGITWVKGKVTIDDALSLANEFATGDTELAAKIQAVKLVAVQIEQKTSEKLQQLDKLGKDLVDASSSIGEIALKLNELAASVKAEIDKTERHRIFILRLIATGIGALLIWKTEFYIFDILAKSPEAAKWAGEFKWFTKLGEQPVWVNILVGSFATAAGSSYWHDQLDRVRKLKVVSKDIKQLRS